MSATLAARRRGESKKKRFRPPRAKTELESRPRLSTNCAAARTPVGASGKGPIRQLPDDAAELLFVLDAFFVRFFFLTSSFFAAPCFFLFSEGKK